MHGKRFTAWMLVATSAALVALFGSSASAAISAEFTWKPVQPDVGEQVTFTSTSSGDIKEYRWDLDADGVYDDATGPTATATFNEVGDHKVRLQIVGTDNTTAQKEHIVRVLSGMKASFTWSPAAPAAGEQVTLTSTSTIKSGSITAYSWDVNGDRKFDDLKGTPVTYTFATAGDHLVGLRTTDNTGGRATAFNTITVGAASPAPEPAPSDPAPAPEPTPFAPEPPAPTATPGQQWLNPFPSVRIRGRATRGGVHLSLFAARAPIGTTLKMRCKGKRCPKKPVRTYTFKSERLRLRGLERFLTAGTRIEVFIWKTGQVGKYTRFVMRRAKAPLRVDRCLYPGGKWPGRCPS